MTESSSLRRVPKSLSHSAVSLYYKDPEEFYLRYLCPHRTPRVPQQTFMAIGAAFDAFEKSFLHERLFGKGSNPQFEFHAIFESQVEPHNRDWALVHGHHVVTSYHESGAHDELLKLLEKSDEPPRFEFTVTGQIGEVPFQGKPDCYFHVKGAPVMLDWKVRGYCSNSNTSPSKDYLLCRDGFAAAKPSSSHNLPHKSFLAYDHNGVTIHAGFMEDSNPDYADQLSEYSWLMGEPVGGEFICAIDEIVASPIVKKERLEFPQLRVANLRARVRESHQKALFEKIQNLWKSICTDHVFVGLSVEESRARCSALDRTAATLGEGDGFFNDITRSVFQQF